MDPLNDLVWNDEDETGVSPASIEGPPMPQICSISESQCGDSGGGTGNGGVPDGLYGGNYSPDDYCGC